MNVDKRLATYHAQNGTELRLTPRQRRRHVKKIRRDFKKEAE